MANQARKMLELVAHHATPDSEAEKAFHKLRTYITKRSLSLSDIVSGEGASPKHASKPHASKAESTSDSDVFLALLAYDRSRWLLKSARADALKRFGVSRLYRVPDQYGDEWTFASVKPEVRFRTVRVGQLGEDEDIRANYARRI